MAAINTVTISGRLVGDPEARQAGNGNVTSFTVAVDKFRKDDGANFIEITAWAKLGEVVAEHLTKGSYVVVSGSLDQQSWDDKETGKKRSKIIVNARDVDFGPKVNGQTQTAPVTQTSSDKQSNPAPINLSEIPF